MAGLADHILTTSQVAQRLGVSQDTVARWTNAGELPCIKTLGGWRKYRQADVDAFAAAAVARGREQAG